MCMYVTMDLEAHSYEVHMKPYIHNFTWNLFQLHKNLLLTSYELYMKIIWTYYKFHVIWNQIHSYEIHEKSIWTSYKLLINIIWNEMKFINMNLYEFVWNSYEFHMAGLMKLICYAHVILMKLTWGS